MITDHAIARAIAMNAHPAGKAGMQRVPSEYPHNVPVPLTEHNALAYLRIAMATPTTPKQWWEHDDTYTGPTFTEYED